MGSEITDHDVELLIDGAAPPGHLAELSLIVRRMRREAARSPELTPGPELAAFIRGVEPAGTMGEGAFGRARRGRGRKLLAGASAFTATVAGKALVGTALAASALGGAHATHLVHVPGLGGPQAATAVETTGSGSGEPPLELPSPGGLDPASSTSDETTTGDAGRCERDPSGDYEAGDGIDLGASESTVEPSTSEPPRQRCGEHEDRDGRRRDGRRHRNDGRDRWDDDDHDHDEHDSGDDGGRDRWDRRRSRDGDDGGSS
jgi:hypothetical protein